MNVVLADDHPIVMIGIRNALLPVKEIRIRGEADSASGLIRLLEHETPDILITDFYMPGSRQGDGIGLVTYVQRNFPAVRLIVLTMLHVGVLGIPLYWHTRYSIRVKLAMIAASVLYTIGAVAGIVWGCAFIWRMLHAG